MKLMVIGGGGREHAIIKKLKENPAVEKIYCLPGATAASPPTRSASVRSVRRTSPRRSNLPRRTALIMPSSRPTTPLPSARSTR